LALRYLADARYSPKEVTCLLGYSEPASFHRAFRQWTGNTPAEYTASTR
jgi:AraC-like DNA-binding protein